MTLVIALGVTFCRPASVRGQAAAEVRAAQLAARAVSASKQQTGPGLAEAEALWTEAATLYERAKRPLLLADVLDSLGAVHRDRGHPDSALATSRRALALWRQAGDRNREAGALYRIGVVHFEGGRLDSALANAHSALGLRRAVGDRRGEGRTLHVIGVIHDDRSRPDSAMIYFRRALTAAQQAGDATGVSGVLSAVGTNHWAAGRPDSALVYLRQALAMDRASGERRFEGRTLQNIATAYSHLGRPDSALAYYQQALAIMRDASDRRAEGLLLGNVGTIHQQFGRSDSALAYHRRALPIKREVGDRLGEAMTLVNIGSTLGDLGWPDSALAAHHQALPIFRQLGHRRAEGGALHNVANAHSDQGRADSALAYFRLALAARRAANDPRGEGSSLNSVGVTYERLGRLDSASAYYRRALAVARATADRGVEDMALHNLGGVHLARGRPDSALAYYRRSLALDHETGNRRGEVTALHQIGLVYQRRGRPDSALAYYRQSLAVARDVGARRAEGHVLSSIGATHAAAHRPDTALAYLHQALAVVRGFGDRVLESETLSHVGGVYLHSFEAARRDPARAAAYFDSAASAHAAVRGHAGSDANAVGVREAWGQRGAFANWPLAWLARAGEVGEARSTLGALAAAERGRAQALLTFMRPTRGVRTPPDRAPVAPAGADLPAEATALLAPLRAAGTAALSYLVTDDTLVTWLHLPDGALHVTRQAVPRDSLVTLVLALRAGLEAAPADATPALARARAALGDVEGRAPAADASTGRPATGGRAGRAAAARIAALLLPGALHRRLPASADLVVVPHGPLALVPFGALPLSSGGPAGAVLGARYAVRVVPALAALDGASAPHPTLRGRALAASLVVGDPTMPELPTDPGVAAVDRRAAKLAPLPGAAREARAVATRLGARALSGRAATEAAVRAALPAAPVVHLATHGLAFTSEARARDSFLALAPDSVSDGLLTAGEVLDDPGLRLTAELVVLSGCQTGLGYLADAEGSVGLARAFLARGARSVLVSLWNVSDRATALLMRRFYAHWLTGGGRVSKAEALRRAQADVRATPGYAHPRYWAPFQLVGAA